MSNTIVINEIADFGKKMKVIAILTLLGLILGIIGAFIFIVLIISWIFALIIIVYFLMVLGDLRKAGRELNNKELLAFTPRFLIGTIIRFIGTALFNIGLLFTEIIWLLVIIGVILILIGSILRYMAWSGLATFFEVHSQLFPPNISGTANTGAKLCKIATILDMTIFLSFVGEILRIIGYFKLAVTKKLLGAPSQPTYQPAAPQPASAPASSTSSVNFCPSCGSSVSSGAKFCPECGSDIN